MKSTVNLKPLIAGVCLWLFWATVSVFADGTNSPAIIPLPQKMILLPGVFTLTVRTRVYADSASHETAGFLAARLRPSTGYPLKIEIKSFAGAEIPGGILLTTKNADTNLGPEGYELTVAPNSVVVRAPAETGLFYGVQTLLQLLPPEVFSSNLVRNVAWQIPCARIEDWPRFKWRGFMLDVSRHFFTKPEVETFLDAMALHKMNVFHWHLTDDHGWRIEIKKYPDLTRKGAWRPGVGFGFDPKSTTAYGPDGRYGGFYSQDDIREVVKYAAARHIVIVPEIEMPGHATAALSAYPQFSCTGGPFEPLMEGGIFNGIYDPAKEETFQFLDGVIAEVAPLFPGKYIHIGGDEVPKETWKNSSDCQALMKREGLKNEEELQSWFTRRIEKIVNAHGHSMIGWSEILQGGLARNAAVMDWIGGAKEAASAGHDVVMTPTAFCYFDFYQSSNHTAEPKAAAWGGPLTLNKVYSFEPMPTNLPPSLQSFILGAQGNLWTEQIPNLRHAEYMTFPRACALAEVAWSAKDARDWYDFMRRLQIHVRRLDELNVNYRRAAVEVREANLWK
ncbi:MAG TPA: beta-N-acetylhexosaminidase [Candidatus Acidoferrum sp.]|nr:beta-N-acetylhexosaminidase [Candidatus Acidoferrum sp.]